MNHEPKDRSWIKTQFLDISYSDKSQAQNLDIYLPNEGKKPYPVLFHIHGGAFKMCDKADYQLDPFLNGLKRGYAVVSANYRMSGEAIFPAAVEDLKAAIRFLRANSEVYGFDKERIYSVGGSAGGNLTLMLAATSGTKLFENVALGNAGFSSDVQGGVAWFPPTDFLKMDAQLEESNLGNTTHNDADSPESEYIGGQITKMPAEKVQAANPMTYITEKMPPLFIQHGKADFTVPYQQSKIFVEKARNFPVRVEYEILPTAEHDDPQFKTDENMEKVLNFLDSLGN